MHTFTLLNTLNICDYKMQSKPPYQSRCRRHERKINTDRARQFFFGGRNGLHIFPQATTYLRVYIYIYIVYIYIYVSRNLAAIYLYILTHTITKICSHFIHVMTLICAYICIQVPTYIYIDIHVPIYIFIVARGRRPVCPVYMCNYICIYDCMYIYIYTTKKLEDLLGTLKIN